MEDVAEVNVSPKKIKKTNVESENINDSTEEQADESEAVMTNGTGNSSKEDISEEDSEKQNGKAIKITKISKTPVKTEPVKDKTKSGTPSPSKKIPKSPTKIPTPSDSPSSSSLSEDFNGFPEITESNELIKKKEAFNRFLSSLEDVGVKAADSDEEAGGEAMTAEEENAADSDSNQMEIDEGNSRADSVEFSDKNSKGRTRDSDVEVMETDSVKSGENVSAKTGQNEEKTGADVPESEEPKVEYCGTCSEVVDDAEEGICCDGKCERWFHLQCSGLSQAEYDELGLDENAKWACSRCSGKPPPEIKPGSKPLLTVRKDLTATPTPKRKMPSKEEKRPRVDISNPIFLKPFDYGWKRELVYRSTNDSQNKKQGDVYYYTPKGKKLRSLREISEHLIGTDLTVDNFTFWKDALGCDPEKEIIRDARMKFLNKDSTPSPAAKKVVTPKTPKTPKTTPKLTATVTPLDSASGLPVAKASASVTPRVVLKAGTKTPTTGPKFKVTPSKTTVPGQTQKIVISKGSEKTAREHKFSKTTDTSKNDDESRNEDEVGNEEIEIVPKNKFRRYGLLANRITTRTARKRRSRSSSSSSSSGNEEITTPEKEMKASLMTKLDRLRAAGLRPRGKEKSNSIKKTENLVHSSISTPMLNGSVMPPLTPDKLNLPSPNIKRPRSPEIQFRPSDPSSYGCQTSSLPSCRPPGANLTGMSSPFCHPFETVLIVDTSHTDSLRNSNNQKTVQYESPPPVPWTQDCSIKVFSVETLPSREDFPNNVASPCKQTGLPPKKQSAFLRAVEGNRNGLPSLMPKSTEECSPVSVASSSTDVVLIEEEGCDNSSPPFLMRNSPPLRCSRITTSPNRSPPSLQANLPPSMLHGSTLLSCPQSHLNSTARRPLEVTVKSTGDSVSSLVSSEDTIESQATGSKYEEYRKWKRERFYERRRAKLEMEKLKRSYQEERKLFIKRKSEEKRLQIEYLRLKVKIKGMKLSLMKRKIPSE